MRRVSLLVLLLILSQAVQLTADNELIREKSQRARVISDDNAALNLEFETSDLNLQHDIIEGEILEHFSIPGEGFTYENGCPVLPAITRLVVVPPEVGVELVVNAGEIRRVDAVVGPVICEDENYMIREEEALSLIHI